MAGMTNINTMKGKVTMVVLAVFFALMAAAALEKDALAQESISTPPSTAPDPSLGTGQPKHVLEPQTAQVSKIKGAAKDGSSSSAKTNRIATVSSSGYAGSVYGLQTYAQGSYYRNQHLEWDPTDVFRSPSYSGTQYINVTRKIYKWNRSTGAWQYWTARNLGTAAIPSGYWYTARSSSYDYYSSVQEHWFVDTQVTWKRPDGSLIAQRTFRTAHPSDYTCLFSAGTCYTGGTAGSLVWITLMS
jgi:hypothetical protein